MPNDSHISGYPVVDFNANKKIPQDLFAEESVLAVCLLNPKLVDEVVSQLNVDDFSRSDYKYIFEAIIYLANKNSIVDIVSVRDRLESTGNLEAAGGISALIDIMTNTYALMGWKTHIEIVKRYALLRKLILAGIDICSLAYDAPDDMDETVARAEQILFNVTEKRISTDFVEIKKLLDDANTELKKLSTNKNKIIGVPTGYPDLDKVIHGLRGGDLVILAARPGIGKTSLALNMSIAAAKAEVSVAYFSLEMSKIELTHRILSSETHIPMEKIVTGNIHDPEWNKIINAEEWLKKLDFAVDDYSNLSVFEARAKARRRLRHIKEAEFGLVVIDYLQLMRAASNTKQANRYLEISEISRGLKVLAKELDVPVIALSQLSRAPEARPDHRPKLSDLRDSGSIEQDADIVLFIDRSRNKEEAESELRPDLGEAELIIAKHRNGPTGTIKLGFDAPTISFRSLIKAETAAAYEDLLQR